MTDDERVKQVLYDLTMKKKELLKEREDLNKIGSFLRKLGGRLTASPERVIFEHQGVTSKWLGEEIFSTPTNAFSEEYLREKTAKIRGLIEAIEGLEQQKDGLGF